MSHHTSQFVYTRPASLRIMLAAYCPNNPSGAGKTMAPPLPHAGFGGISRPAPAGRVEMEENMNFVLWTIPRYNHIMFFCPKVTHLK